MQRIGLYCIIGGIVTLFVLVTLTPAMGANAKDRIDYWRSNYDTLSVAEDARVERAQAIFKRVLDAAGSKPGVVPRLLVIKQDPFGISLPIAIPDGWVIISKGTLDICYRDHEHGDDRLAFVLAHEIAHQLRDDFWHMQFFTALETLSEGKAEHHKHLEEEIRSRLSATDELWAKELQADERGIIYAAMAGFNPDAVVVVNREINFFNEWVETLTPQRLGPMYQSPSHPSPRHRAAVVQARLHQVIRNIDVFNLGLQFYQAGDYARAIRAFEHFLEYFPSREVYHNLAASHHQLALRYYRQWKPHELPFQLSMSIDPVTRASHLRTRGLNVRLQSPEMRFRDHIDKAIAFYETAIALDPAYSLSYNNLGCARILTQDAFKAIGTLKDALKLRPNDPQVLNNLGVAFFVAELAQPAQRHLALARQFAPQYAAPLFNLGKIAQAEGRYPEAHNFWRAYGSLDATSAWLKELQRQGVKGLTTAPAAGAPAFAREQVLGLSVGTFEDEIPAKLGLPPSIRTIPLAEEPLRVARYPHGLVTLSQEQEIVMIIALEAYEGKSAGGIAIGSPQHELLKHYRTPSRSLAMTQGESWVYDDQGIAFQLREGKVVSWLLF
jgi:tetratricopeptide (TPR) repeat protein